NDDASQAAIFATNIPGTGEAAGERPALLSMHILPGGRTAGQHFCCAWRPSSPVFRPIGQLFSVGGPGNGSFRLLLVHRLGHSLLALAVGAAELWASRRSGGTMRTPHPVLSPQLCLFQLCSHVRPLWPGMGGSLLRGLRHSGASSHPVCGKMV